MVAIRLSDVPISEKSPLFLLLRNRRLRQRKKPFLHTRLSYLFGMVDRPEGEKTDERETLKPIAVVGESCPLFARWHFPPKRERKPMLA